MKRGWKVFWIICGSVFCLGAVFGIAGRVMGTSFDEAVHEVDARLRFLPGLSFFASSDVYMETGSDEWEYEYGERSGKPGFQESYSGIRKIDVDTAGIQLQVLASPDEAVHVEAVNVDKRLRFKCEQEGDELDISTTKKLRAINRIDGYATVWLLLPKGQLKELDLENEAGEVYVAGADAIDFTLKVGAGQAQIDSFTAQTADFECGAGQITATGTIQREGGIECGVGEIVLNLSGKETDYNCDVECGIGEVQIGERSFSGIGVSRSGLEDDYDYDDYDDDYDYEKEEYHVKGTSGGKELSVECGIGSVQVNFTES